MRNRRLTVVGVEHSFLMFDHVQSGAAEMAALQCGEKSFGIEQRTACRIDDEGALAHVLHASTIEKMMRVRSQWCVEGHHVAPPQQHVKRHILGRRRTTTVTGQYAAAEPRSLSITATPMRPVPTTPTVMSRSSFPGWSCSR